LGEVVSNDIKNERNRGRNEKEGKIIGNSWKQGERGKKCDLGTGRRFFPVLRGIEGGVTRLGGRGEK